MASQTHFVEGHSITRPPYFDGTNYQYWKNRMQIWLEANSYELWDCIARGPYKVLARDQDNKLVPKDPASYDEADRKKLQINAQAKNALFCALHPSEYDRISACDFAKEMWDKLQVAHEGTNEVKKSKINMLVQKYELFKMKSDEEIKDMFTRFTKITNELKLFDRVLPEEDKVRKILRSLPKSWSSIKTTIEEAHDLSAMTVEMLQGKLLTHEMAMKNYESDDDSRKKKSVAFKSSSKDESESDEEDDEEFVLLARKFKRFLRKDRLKNYGQQKKYFKSSKGKGESSKRDEIICYKCKKAGHIKSECPNSDEKSLKAKKKKKAMVATWSCSEDSSSSKEESDMEAHFCLMAKDDADEGSFKEKLKKEKWYLDSGCSRHMTGDKSQFLNLEAMEGGTVTFGDNAKGHIKGIGQVGKNSGLIIENVYYVQGLKHNLISISQLCDKGHKIIFESNACKVLNIHDDEVLFVGKRKGNVYIVDFDDLSSYNVKCLMAKNESESWLWHRRLGHASMHLISNLSKKDLVLGLPKLVFEKDKICDACQQGKQTKISFKSKKDVTTSRPLELLHLDLFGPIDVTSLGGKKYTLVIVDDYSRYTWTAFLAHKKDTFSEFTKFCKKVQNEKGFTITCIRSDHGGEFENDKMKEFCNSNGIEHNFSSPRTPQQNGVVERKNRTLQEMGRTMLCENQLPKYFWAEAINTACYILNRVLIRSNLNKTPYELWKNKKPNISHFRAFGCKCFVHNNGKENLGKFDAKSDEAVFLGYSLTSRAYRVYNKRTLVVEESMHVTFAENNVSPRKVVLDDDAGEIQTRFGELHLEENSGKGEGSQKHNDVPCQDFPKTWKFKKDHPKDQIIGDIENGVTTRSHFDFVNNFAFISHIEPKNVNDALEDENWFLAMQEELN
ncbi:hypothetical protein SLEP1_g48027 [Rubroshorea leprosula]|uniref:Uncharacterized protein n=1 Tax=Rubroshorea leprosula TaxID=152421 RepID=A0AAV5LV59_9ROSI|nr:hypothetical protein SLEP1_g48027 [Rubroshorea leprosula]